MQSALMPPYNRNVFALLIFVFSVLLYSNTLNHGYVLDDTDLILNNTQVKDGARAIASIFTSKFREGTATSKNELYRPISKLMLALEWQLSPGNPLIGHLFNILLYALLCTVLYKVLLLLFYKSPLAAFICSLFFMLHPLHTEVVANIKSIDEILCLLFFLVAVLSFHHYQTNGKKIQLISALLFYLLSVFSKESAVTFVLVFPIFFYFTSPSFEKFSRTVKKTLPFLIPLFIFLICRHFVLGDYDQSKMIGKIDNYLISAPTSSKRLATALSLLLYYLRLFVLPLQLCSDYSFSTFPLVNMSSPKVLLLISSFFVLIVFIIKTIKNRSAEVFGFLFFIVTFSLTSNVFFLIGTSFGERLLFTPSLGLSISLIAVMDRVLQKSKNLKIVVGFAGTLILACFAFLTITRNSDWKSNLSLFSADLERNTQSARLHFNYANALKNEIVEHNNEPEIQELNLPLIESHLNKALSIYPPYGSAHFALGEYFLHRNLIRPAYSSLLNARYYLPRSARVYSGLSMCMLQLNKPDSALFFAEQGLAYSGANSDLFLQKGKSFQALNQIDSARFYFRLVLVNRPDDPTAKTRLVELEKK